MLSGKALRSRVSAAAAGAAMLAAASVPSVAFPLPSAAAIAPDAGVERVWWDAWGRWHPNHYWGWRRWGYWRPHPWGYWGPRPWGWGRPVYGYYGPVRHCWIGAWGYRHCVWRG